MQIHLLSNLLDKAEQLFMRYGIRSVTMDDLARELGISKKTLYQLVPNKEELLATLLATRAANENESILQLRDQSANAVEEIMQVSRFIIGQMSCITPAFRYDLEKYYQSTFKQLDELHKAYFLAFTIHNLERGIQEGLYRNDLDAGVVGRLFVSMATHIGHHDMFDVHAYNLDYLIIQAFKYHMNGILSEEGRTLMASLPQLHLHHAENPVAND